MYHKVINLALVVQVSEGLKELREKMVFIAGAVISLYTDDPTVDEIRPTTDIDMTINLANYAEWAKMQERLAELSFSSHGNPNLSFRVFCFLLNIKS